MRINQKVPPVNRDASPSPLRIKEGRVKLILTDRDGHEEVVADHNMATNGVNALLAECGWLNKDNLNQNNLVEQLLGGVVLLDTALTEDANNFIIPSAIGMTANGAVGVENNSDPEELGSYNSLESGTDDPRGRGWQDDGSYLEVFDWSNNHGNGTVAAVCAMPKVAGECGLGNSHGAKLATPVTLNMGGTSTDYLLPGFPCKVDLPDSSCYAVDFDTENDEINIYKCRLPMRKVNLKCAPSYPMILSKRTITMPAGIKSVLQDCPQTNLAYSSYGVIQDTGTTLNIISRGNNETWGSGYTPTLYEIDPTDGTITTSTLSNTSGDELHTICQPVWLGRNKLAWIDGYWNTTDSRPTYVDGRTIYSMERTSGSWGTIKKCTNPEGSQQPTYVAECGWAVPYCMQNYAPAGKGRVYMIGDSSGTIVCFDFEANTCYMTNGKETAHNGMYQTPTSAHMIYAQMSITESGRALRLRRVPFAISTIFNLQTPIRKTSDKSMKLTYRFTFEED